MKLRWGFFLLTALVSAAGFSACGSGSGTNFNGSGDSGGGGSGDGGQDGFVFVRDGGGSGDGAQGTLSILPANATIKVTELTSVPSETYSATLANGSAPKPVTPIWSLADYTIGAIDSTGVFRPKGNVGGVVTVQASYEGLSATTTLDVVVNLETSLANVTLPDGTMITEDATQISTANAKALGNSPDGGVFDAGPPSSEPGPSSGWSTLVYPYDQTVFPQGLLAPVIQYTAGSITPQDFKISLDTTDFHWDGFGHVGNAAALQAAIPQNIWDGALSSAQPDPTTKEATVTLSLVLASGGVAYGPFVSHLIIAPGSLTGVIYFESYGSDVVMSDAGNGGTDFGLWSVKPGSTSPPSNLQSGCVICHGVSAAGNTLTTGTDEPTIGYATGVYRIESDGTYTHLATAPPNLPYAGGAGDSRGLGWGSVSPDGKIVLRGLNNFWGGQELLAWAVPDSPLLYADGGVAPLTTTLTVNGDFNMFVPSWSVDEQHLVYINAANTGDAGSAGAPSQSVGIVDVLAAVNDGGVSEAGVFGSVSLSKPRTIYDSTAAGSTPAGTYTKVPAFLPDSKTIVYEETVDDYAGFNNMLPDYAAGPYVDGTLYALQPNSSGGYTHIPLTNANASYDPNGVNHNYEPHPLPVQVGGYYWIVFASMRKDAYPQLGFAKKLWVSAITPGTAAGKDPSHPPFTLVNQSIVAAQPVQRGYWALAPCEANGTSCTTGSDCCNGSCLPSSPTDPSSPLVCRVPTMTCSNIGGRCKAGDNADCCGASFGVQCIGTLNGFGTCGVPAPH